MGDKLANLSDALFMLAGTMGTPISVSSVYETEPWGVEHHDYYLNIAASFETILSPEKVFQLISVTEKKLGRTRSKNTVDPRTIDVDMLFYNNIILKTQKLTIPHPRIPCRKFVLVPLAEIMENFSHPESGITIKELLLQCPDNCSVLKTDLKLFMHDV